MGELAPEVADMAVTLAAADLVGPELLEPVLGLALAQAGFSRPEVLEQKVEALLRIHLWLVRHRAGPDSGSQLRSSSDSPLEGPGAWVAFHRSFLRHDYRCRRRLARC